MENFSHWAIAYYYLDGLADPEEEIRLQKEFCKEKEIVCRIYINGDGINGQLSASHEAGRAYIDWMHARLPTIEFKIHETTEHAFPKQTIKYREQLVAFDAPLDLKERALPLSPQEWKKMLEQKGDETLLIDVRNAYESQIGHFEEAILPACDHFRDFPAYTENLLKDRDPETTRVMMYCTGGIRCEYFSAYLRQKGFTSLYQLEGGVIGYGLEVGDDYWKGKLFVFDDRLAIPLGESSEPISHCLHCRAECDTYINCANTDCNELFICCEECQETHRGTCRISCEHAPRLRPWNKEGKPFRKYATLPT